MLLEGIATGVIANVVTALAGPALGPVAKILRDAGTKAKLAAALKTALKDLSELDPAFADASALDLRPLHNKKVVPLLWPSLLAPAVNDEIDVQGILAVIEGILSNQPDLTEEAKRKQQEAIEFVIDRLVNELPWQFPELAGRLETGILRQLDAHLTPLNRTLIIKAYLELELTRVTKDQNELMAGATYIEPAVEKLAKRPDRSEAFRKRDDGPKDKEGPSKEQQDSFVEVDFNQYLLAGPDRHLAIVADSGYGKSTLLREVFRRACAWRDYDPVPVLFSDGEGSVLAEDRVRVVIHERLSSAFQTEAGRPRFRAAQVRTLADELKDTGRLFLLCDALDQMKDARDCAQCLGGPTMRPHRVIVTARPEAWERHRSRFGGFAHLRLVRFDTRRMKEYYEGILDRPELRSLKDDFLGVPVLASQLRQLLHGDPEAAAHVQSRSDLYREFISYFSRRTQDANALADHDPATVVDDLRDLSFEALRKGHLGSLPRSVARDILGRDGDRLEALIRTNWIVRFLETGDELTFRHRSFQEYLAACVLKQKWDEASSIEPIRQYLFHPNWEEPLSFLAGMVGDKAKLEELLATVIDARGEQALAAWQGNVELACRCLRESRHQNARGADRVLKVIGRLADHGSMERAVELLAVWGRGTAVDGLIAILADTKTDSDMRWKAAKALGAIADKSAVQPLITLLANLKTDSEVRWRAADALGAIADKSAIQPLINALSDTDGELRGFAADALGAIADKSAVQPLIALLANLKTASYVRRSAVDALGAIADKSVIQPLINALSDTDRHVRFNAVIALGAIADKSAVQPLINALSDTYKTVRCKAADALGAIADKSAVQPLINALSDTHGFVRLRAAAALDAIADPAAVQSFIAVLSDPKAASGLRQEAARALGAIADKSTVQPLINALSDPDSEVRWKAADALGAIADKSAVQPLINALSDTYKTVRWKAAAALCAIADPAAVQSLIAVLSDPKAASGLHQEAARALGAIADKSAVQPLINALSDPDSEARESATSALGALADSAAVRPLIAVLDDTKAASSVREKAADALVSLASESPDELLDLALKRLADNRKRRDRNLILRVLRAADTESRRRRPLP